MGFSPAQAARLTGCSRAQLDHWAGSGLVVAEAGPDGLQYSFRHLIALRVVTALLDAGLSLPRLRRALRYLVDSGEDPAGLRLLTDGDSVWACRSDGQILDALRRGQLVLFVAVDRFVEEIDAEVRAFDAERRRFVETLGSDALDVARS